VRRRVALKIIKLGMDTKEVIARFEQERQALAMMDHPNIAKVLDAGATQFGRPFFVMELVRGVPITEYCDQNQLPTLERLGLFIAVCQAVQHAHQKGIIHRDIKPSNILVTLHDGVPVPKVIDFGIAKATEGRLTDATVYTQMHQFVGTPAYMSPEQAEMSGLDIDTRSDIYSLGVLLYELLTGRTPFDARELMSQGLDAMRRTIREQEPPRPSTKLATLQADELTTTAKRRSSESAKLVHQLKGDLDWIVMKCLEKDRNRRYETANAFAQDIRRFLADEPVSATPPSAGYQFRKFARRNKAALRVAASIAAVLVTATLVSTWQAVRATRAESTQKRLREQVEASHQKAMAESASNQRVASMMMEMAKTLNPTYWLEHGPAGWDEPLDAVSLRALEALEGSPDQEAEWCALMIRMHHDLGLLQEFSQSLPIPVVVTSKPRSNSPPVSQTTLSFKGWPDGGHAQVNHYQRMAELSRRALRLGSEKVNRDPVAHAESLATLGDALRHAGQLTEARAHLREALVIQRQRLGATDPSLGQTLYQLAIVEKLLGETDAANANFEEGTGIIAKHYAQDALARAYVGLARAAWNLGSPAAVEHILCSALRISQKSGIATFIPLRQLANTLKVPERQLYEEAVRIETKNLGATHPAVQRLHKIAESGKPASRTELQSAYQETLDLLKVRLGADDPDTLKIRDKLAAAYWAAGRVSESLPLDEETLNLRRTANALQHPETLAVMTRLERSYRELGRLEDARKLHEEIQKVREALNLPAETEPVRVPMTTDPAPRRIRVIKPPN
jgi:tetratricopeptide (TPR) repeat protein